MFAQAARRKRQRPGEVDAALIPDSAVVVTSRRCRVSAPSHRRHGVYSIPSSPVTYTIRVAKETSRGRVSALLALGATASVDVMLAVGDPETVLVEGVTPRGDLDAG